jgi:hypothetical protein
LDVNGTARVQNDLTLKNGYVLGTSFTNQRLGLVSGSAVNSFFDLYPQSATGGIDVGFTVWSKGSPSSITNYELLEFRYDNTNRKYALNSSSGGTGSILPIDIYTGANTSQFRLATSGNVLVGTTTDGGYRFDVSGTFRSTLDANINGLTVGKGLASVSQNTAFGVTALASNTTGNAVTAIGYQAGNANTGSSHNTYIGNQSGAFATGANNTFVGSGSGYVNTGGAQNTFIGTFSGYEVTSGTYNTTLGYNTGRGITTGSYNTIIGAQVTGLSSSLANTIILADGQGNQRLYIDNIGEVGIGTTSPNYKLHVVNSTQNIAQALFTGSSSPFIQTGVWGVLGQHLSSQATFIGNNAYPSDGGNQSWTRIGAAGSLVGWINIGEAGMFFASGINAATGSSRNDSKMALFPTGNFGVGNGVTDISSAILSATSTTKGFLPPRMTGAQAEAITGPAEGLMVYANNGNGVTITSIGWWGFNGTTWVKLN